MKAMPLSKMKRLVDEFDELQAKAHRCLVTDIEAYQRFVWINKGDLKEILRYALEARQS